MPFIMVVALSIPGGLIADRIGFRKAAGIGATIIMAGSLLRGIATDFPSLLAFTLVYGIGLGLAFPTLPKFVSVWLPREKAGLGTGIFMVGLTVGVALPVAITLPVVYPITNSLNGTFFIWAMPTIVAAILWWTMVKDPPGKGAEKLSQSSVAFRQVLQNKNVWLVAFLMLLNNSFMFTWTAWTPALMMQKGAAPELASLISSLSMWVVIPTVFVTTRLSYKLGVRKPFIWIPSFILAFASLGAIFMSVPAGWFIMSLAGIVNAARFVTIFTLPVELMSKETVGRASGLIVSLGYVGSTIGPLVGGHLFDLTGNLVSSFIVLIGIAIATGSLGLIMPETGSKLKK